MHKGIRLFARDDTIIEVTIPDDARLEEDVYLLMSDGDSKVSTYLSRYEAEQLGRILIDIATVQEN